MTAKRVLLKVGGAALVDPNTLSSVIQGITNFQQQNYQVIVVHGGGPAINTELTHRGITWSFVNGQRVTSSEMMSVIEEVLFERVNTSLVQAFNSSLLIAKGLSGADQMLICKQLSKDLGQVGSVENVQISEIEKAFSQNPKLIPVIAPLGVGKDGTKYNINADWAACHLAGSLEVDQLIYLTDQDGVWDQNKNIINQLTPPQIQQLIENGSIQGGMLTKMNSILYALQTGVSQIQILNGKNANQIFSKETLKTICQNINSQTEVNAHVVF